MAEAAKIALQQCADVRADQKTRLAAEQQTDLQHRTDMLAKADAAERLIQLSATARFAEWNYRSAKDASFVDANHAAMNEIYQLCAT